MIDAALLITACLLLRAYPPTRAHAMMRKIGRLLPMRETGAELRRASERLRGGSCLSRSLALAARAPSADVVIGVELTGGTAFFAHAWLEVDRSALTSDDPRGTEIARLSCRS